MSSNFAPMSTSTLAPRQKSLLYAAAVAALASNLLANPVNAGAATVAVSSTAPNLTGFTNLIPALGGFVASHTFNTTAGSNVLTNYTYVSGAAPSALSVGMPVVDRSPSGQGYPANIPPGTYVTAVNTTTNTITLSKAATATATGISVGFFPRAIKPIGGVMGGSGGTATLVMGTAGNAATPPTAQNNNYVPVIFETNFDGANFTTAAASLILQIYSTTTSSLNAFRIAVDDAYLSAGATAMAVSGTNYISLTLANAGAHKIRVELPGGTTISGIYLYNGSRVWVPSSRPRALIISDSFGNGGAAAAFGPNNLFHQLCIRMGWECYTASVSGTGYVSAGSPASNYNWADPMRLRDASVITPDIIVFSGSPNDASAPAASVTANALTAWQNARALYPNVPIVIFGISASITSPTGYPTQETALASAFATWNDGKSWFFPQVADTDGAWISSTNTSLYINSVDSLHPSYAIPGVTGTDYIARRMADKVMNTVIPALTA